VVSSPRAVVVVVVLLACTFRLESAAALCCGNGPAAMMAGGGKGDGADHRSDDGDERFLTLPAPPSIRLNENAGALPSADTGVPVARIRLP
jgi:hypothetical protein